MLDALIDPQGCPSEPRPCSQSETVFYEILDGSMQEKAMATEQAHELVHELVCTYETTISYAYGKQLSLYEVVYHESQRAPLLPHTQLFASLSHVRTSSAIDFRSPPLLSLR
jgi:hypothetical protein